MSVTAAHTVRRVLKGFNVTVKSAPTLDLERTYDNRFADQAARRYI